MIRTETVIINGKEFIKTYSDEYLGVMRDGVTYSEAIDPVGTGRTYTEAESYDEYSETMAKAAAYDILTDGEFSEEDMDAKARAYDILIGGES